MNDKQQFELFAVAVLFKIYYSNSIVGKVDNKRLRKELHCKHNVAKRILENMQSSKFFAINQKTGIVFVPTFKSSEMKTFGRCRKSYQSNSDSCVTIETKNYTLREIKHVLREKLLGKTIRTRQTQQFQRLGGVPLETLLKCVTIAKEYVLTLKHLSLSFGLSRSSASRYIKKMENDGKVSKTLIVAERVVPVLNDKTALEWMEKNPGRTLHAWHCRYGWSGWQCYGRIYMIVDRGFYESYKHVIWKHKDRLQSSTKYVADRPDGDAYWNRHN